MDDDAPRSTPAVVVGAIAAGVAPLPFLAIYAVLFIAHGTIHPVSPPDITSTKGGELVAGLIALALLIVLTLSVTWLLNGRRRWLFVLGQMATLVTAVDFLADSTTGPPAIPILLLATSATALVLALLPATGRHVRRRPPARRRTSEPAAG